MQIAILCGGEGKRIKKLFPHTPKGLIEIDKRPFMSYIFDSLINNGISKVVMCTGLGHDDYFYYFKNKYKNLQIAYSQDPKESKLGTGGAILNACGLLENIFFVQYGDSLLDVDYEKVLDSHIESKKKMTMTVLPIELSNENPNVFFDKKNNLVKYEKGNKNKNKTFKYIDYGLLVFKKNEILKYKNSKNVNLDLGLIQSNLCESNDCNVFVANKKYLEIGTPESFTLTKNILSNT